MNTEQRPPRRPLVPGPTTSSISAQAIAKRDGVNVTGSSGGLSGGGGGLSPNAGKTVVVEHRSTLPMTGIGHLAAGIAGVMAEVGTIKKGGYNSFHNYHYARLEDLLEAITPLMGKHGVVVIQNEVERNIVETRLAVTYEFSIIHSSGEVWPERPRFTGMAMGRDSKGNWDDKAINKCHSAARKYFLLSLFQVPAGDFDDADQGPAQQAAAPASRERVPGPAKLTIPNQPQKIGLGPGKGPEEWSKAYLACIEKAKTEDELRVWDALNESVLHTLYEKHGEVYDKIEAAVQRRLSQLAPNLHTTDKTPIEGLIPTDPQELMNWIAQQLMDMKTYEAAEAFWNQIVAPRESGFDEVDWGMLLKEWERTELRLAPLPPEAA